jgi:hypothetical protein
MGYIEVCAVTPAGKTAAAVAHAGKGAKERSKTKYSCPSCNQNAWAKPDSALVCGQCMEPMEAEA